MASSTGVPVGATGGGSADSASRRAPRWRGYVPVMVCAAVLAVVPIMVGDSRYVMSLAVLGLVYAGYGVGFNVIFGDTNQLFLCLGALAGVGAYTTTILGNRADLPLAVTITLGVAVAALLGALLSWVSVRRRLDVIFVGIIALTFSLMFQNLLLGQRELTGGETGAVVEFDAGIVGDRGVAAYYVFLALLIAVLVVHRWLQRSHVGWAFRALRDDALAAELAGVDVARYKVLAGVIGSAIIGLTGALHAAYEGFISPAAFTLGNVDIPVLVMLAFGGVGRLLAPVVGASVFTVIDEAVRPLSQVRDTVYGLTLLALFLGFRRGLIPTLGDLFRRLSRRRPPGRPPR